MVAQSIERPVDGRIAVRDPRVLEVFRTVPRHVFVPFEVTQHAYADRALPNYANRRVSQPYILARMIELLDAQERHRVLELGTSSGYQAALLAHLAGEVYSVEPNALVSERAATTLSLEGYERVHTRCGDPHQGWAEAGPFDRVLVCGAVAEVPPAVWDQLAPGGRIVAPLGLPGTRQWLTIVRKTVGGEREVEQVSPLSFSALPGGALAGSLPPPARPR